MPFKITDKQKNNINKTCISVQKSQLGDKIQALGEALDNSAVYSGDLLTAQEIKMLNTMCFAANKAQLGTILNKLMNDETDIVLTQNQANDLNNMCMPFNNIKLGNWINAVIIGDSSIISTMSLQDEGNMIIENGEYSVDGDVIIDAIAISIPNTEIVNIGKSKEINIEWTPIDVTDRIYTVTSSAKTKATVEIIDETKFKINGLAVGTSTITIKATNSLNKPSATMTLTVAI